MTPQLPGEISPDRLTDIPTDELDHLASQFHVLTKQMYEELSMRRTAVRTILQAERLLRETARIHHDHAVDGGSAVITQAIPNCGSPHTRRRQADRERLEPNLWADSRRQRKVVRLQRKAPRSTPRRQTGSRRRVCPSAGELTRSHAGSVAVPAA